MQNYRSLTARTLGILHLLTVAAPSKKTLTGPAIYREYRRLDPETSQQSFYVLLKRARDQDLVEVVGQVRSTKGYRLTKRGVAAYHAATDMLRVHPSFSSSDYLESL